MNRLLPLALFALVLTTTALAESLDQLYGQFKEEARGELKSALDKSDAQNNSRLLRLESLIVEGLPSDSLEDANPRAVLRTLTQIRTMTKEPKVEALAQKLVEEVRKLRDRKEKEFADNFTASLRQAAETMLKATKAAELDGPMGVVQRAQKEASQMVQDDGSRVKGVDFEEAQGLLQLMSVWQDTMVSLAAPPAQGGGRNITDNLEANLSNYSRFLNEVLPRSVLIESVRTLRQRVMPNAPKRMTTDEMEAAVREVVKGVAKLDDLAPAVGKIEGQYTQQRELYAGSYYVNYFANESPLLVALRVQRRNYEDLKDGITVSLPVSAPGGPDAPDELATVRGLVLRFSLPRVLAIAAPVKDGESPGAYLARMAERARKEKDWPLLAQVFDAAQTLSITVVANPNDAGALRQMLAGANLERARQPVSAVAAYLTALKSGSQAVPAEWIGEKLEALRKAGPADFEAGVKLAATMPVQEIRPAPAPVLQVPPPPKAVEEPANPPAFPGRRSPSGMRFPQDIR